MESDLTMEGLPPSTIETPGVVPYFSIINSTGELEERMISNACRTGKYLKSLEIFVQKRVSRELKKQVEARIYKLKINIIITTYFLSSCSFKANIINSDNSIT